MAKTAPVQFTVRPLKDGSAYLVIYSPQGGMEQQISGFASESEAKDWIANKSMRGEGRHKSFWRAMHRILDTAPLWILMSC
jgi:hypothetical protein